MRGKADARHDVADGLSDGEYDEAEVGSRPSLPLSPPPSDQQSFARRMSGAFSLLVGMFSPFRCTANPHALLNGGRAAGRMERVQRPAGEAVKACMITG